MTRTMRNLFGGASVAALLVVGTSAAMATPIDLNGYFGPIQIKFTDYEAFTGSGGLAVSNSNYGILQVTSILDKFGDTIYQAPLAGSATSSNPYIVGVFSGIHIGSTTSSGAEADTAGTFSFYDVTNPATTFGVIASQGSTGYTSIGCSAKYTVL